MPLKKEPCRNFQRGSCRYGDKCKFLHVTQQQPRSNAFGFGSQTGSPFQQTNFQQQKPNPFGFGVQNSGPANGAMNSGGFNNQSNAFKPFENKWVRQQQPANQSQATSHECTDPASCKRQIAEDFEQERPLWKLTSYGHHKYMPCDITGDVSYEELWAAAYDEAKRGVGLQAIVERERNLLNAKLVEFDSLLRNPYMKQQSNPSPFPTIGSTNLAQPSQSPFPAVGPTTPSLPAQNMGPPAVSGFGQVAPSPNMTFGVRPSNPPNNAFGQFQGSPGPFGSSNMPSASFGSQAPVQTSANPFASNTGPFGNPGMNTQGSQLPSTFPVSSQFQSPAVNQPPTVSNGPSATDSIQQMSTNSGLGDNNVPLDASTVDASIWTKEEWKLGEIPEQPPPAQFVR